MAKVWVAGPRLACQDLAETEKRSVEIQDAGVIHTKASIINHIILSSI